MRKLTETDVRLILRCSEGMRHGPTRQAKLLAPCFGVTWHTVKSILTGVTWMQLSLPHLARMTQLRESAALAASPPAPKPSE